MRRRTFLAALGGAAVARPLAAAAQQPTAIPRIGVLMGANPTVEAARLGAFRGALERLGYSDGQTILIELRYAEGHIDRFDGLARELVALAPAVIACVGTPETRALQAATRSIPIVFMQAQDPVELGFVASLARPGGNTTGFSMMSAELDAKRLELLHEIAPSLSRAAFLINPGTSPPGLAKRLADAEAAASEALLVQGDPLLSGTESRRIIDFAVAHRLPTVFENNSVVARGGLLSYGPDLLANARLAAGYVDKILKGASPADLPVQQSVKFVLAINLNTAKELGLTVPQSITYRADEVIE